VSEITPTFGTALGWELITVFGSGFLQSSGISYTLNFTRQSNTSTHMLSTPLVEFVNESVLLFRTPGWGYEFPGGVVNVTLVMHWDHLVAPYTVTGEGYYSFVPSWTPETISPNTGLPTGGETVYLDGFGFGDADTYTCRFSSIVGGRVLYSVDGEATFVDAKKLACVTPTWDYGARMALVSLFFSREQPEGLSLELAAQSSMTALPGFYYIDPKGQNGLFEFVESWENLTADATGALGGHQINVSGYAFDSEPTSMVQSITGEDITYSDKAYVLQLAGASYAVNSSACAFVDEIQLQCIMPTWRSEAGVATVTLYKTWVRTIRKTRLRQSRVVTKQPAENITLEIVPEVGSFQPTFGPLQGGTRVTVMGAGFKSSSTYTCKFEQGSDEQVNQAVEITNASVVCGATQEWTTTVSVDTTFTLLDSNVSVFSVGSANSQFTFAFINKQPDFNATNVVVTGNTTALISIPWVTDVCAGVLPTGGCDPDEASQVLVYHIEVDQDSLFNQAPNVSNTNLEFSIAPGQAGVAFITVYAVDDGGTSYGGVDTSPVKSYFIDIQPVTLAPGGNVAQSWLTFDGDLFRFSGLTEVVAFFVVDAGAHNYLQSYSNVTVKVQVIEGPANIFKVLPQIYANGSLLFEVVPGAFGNVTFNVSTYVFDSISNTVVFSSVDEFTIEITKVSLCFFAWHHPIAPLRFSHISHKAFPGGCNVF
jgi:hypothetical protein